MSQIPEQMSGKAIASNVTSMFACTPIGSVVPKVEPKKTKL